MTTFDKKFISPILIVMLMIAVVGTGDCQHALRVDFGYGLSANSGLMGTNLEYTESGNNTLEKETGVYGSFGKGIRLNFGYTYGISDRFSIFIDATKFKADDWAFTFNETYTDTGNRFAHSKRLSLNSWFFQPGLKYYLHKGEKLSPYASLAAIFARPKTQAATEVKQNGVLYVESREESESDLSLGTRTALGIEYALGNKIKLNVEASLNSLNFSLRETRLTFFEVAGVNRLSTFDDEELVLLYKETTSSNSKITDVPEERVKSKLPLGSFSLTVGLSVVFGKESGNASPGI